MVQFTDRLQMPPQPLVVPHPLTDLGSLLGTKAELANLASWISHGQHPGEVSPSGGALRTPPSMADSPLEQGTSHDLGRIGELPSKSVASFDNLFTFHSTK